MISLIDEAIKDFLIKEASLLDVDVSFEVPTKEWSGGLDKTTINLYLFDIRENTELRKNQWEAVRNNDGTITQQKPPARVDLFYIVTPYSTSTQQNAKILEEHHLLSKILAVVHNYSFIPKEPYLTDNLLGISPIPEIPIEAVHPKFLDEQGGFQIWSALDQFLKPAVYIKVTIPIELQQKIKSTMALAKILKYKTPQLETFVQLGGIVTDSASEPSPISGAEMNLLDSSGKVLEKKSTDENGRFLFKSVADGKYTIKADAEGYQEKAVDIDRISEAKMEKLIIRLEIT